MPEIPIIAVDSDPEVEFLRYENAHNCPGCGFCRPIFIADEDIPDGDSSGDWTPPADPSPLQPPPVLRRSTRIRNHRRNARRRLEF
jgi:hypothetical protein